MKLQCDQCGAKYVISDEKVRGNDRVFKIRCKNCREIITISGIGAEGSEVPEAEWYYAIDGDQSGPVAYAELQQVAADGTINDDTYVWKAGMDDWRLIGDVESLSGIMEPDHELADLESADDLLDDIVREAEEARSEFETNETTDPEVQSESADTAEEPVSSAALETEDNTQAPNDAELSEETTVMDTQEDGSPSEPLASDPDDEMTQAEPTAEVQQIDDGATQVDFDLAAALAAGISPPQTQTEEAPSPFSEDEPTDEPTDEPEVSHIDEPEADSGAEIAAQNTLDNLFIDAQEDGSFFPDADAEKADDLDGLANADDEDKTTDDDMVWRRNENSVLFSMGDLEKEEERSAEKDRKAAAIAALTADSGLIDIRSFSNKHPKSEPGDLFAAISGDSGAASPDHAAKPVTLSSAAAVPIVRRRSNPIAIWGGVVAAMIVVAATTAWIVIEFVVPKAQPRASDPSPGVAVASNTPSQEAATLTASRATATQPPGNEQKQPAAANTTVAAADTTKPEAAPAGTPEPTESAVAATPEPQPAAEKKEPETPKVKVPEEPKRPLTPREKRIKAKRDKERKEKQKAQREKRAKEKADRALASKDKKARDAAKKKAQDAKKKKTNPRIDPNALLGQIKKQPKKVAASPTAGGPDVPQKLSSSQIRRVVRRAAGRIRRCVAKAGLSGVQVTTSFTITPGGGVAGARVRGPVAATSAAGCVRSAIKGLRFPKSRSSKRVNYPFYVK